jgi:uncharacterized protein DUF4229
MRSVFAYSTARILLFVAATFLLYLVGARGFLLLVLAVVVSALASYVLLSRQRDRISGAITNRVGPGRPRRIGGLRTRLEEGARVEDQD